VASLRKRLEALEEARRARAADELRKRLRTVSDEDIARCVLGFRRGEAEEDYVPESLADLHDLFEEAMGDLTSISEGEANRRVQLITGDLLESRGSGIQACIRKLEMVEVEGEDE
jgi:methyl coenzyme M reductase gamma subunit